MHVLLLSLILACDTGQQASPHDRDNDGVEDALDCAPDDPNVGPGQREFCDGVDNDCDGAVDETFDLDLDGFLADEADCREYAGRNGLQVDCDDLDAYIHPGAAEVCDGRDNDCSGVVDDAPDEDGDGFTMCEDCNDADPFVHPGALEACDAIDNDCSGGVDEPFDEDGDGRSECDGDCDDDDPNNAPHLPEICDNRDNDCDGEVDEGFDVDLDGVYTCDGDCDDTNPDVNPFMPEICDGAPGVGIDTNCDGVNPDYADLDADGYTRCGDDDCVDNDPAIHPDAVEVCNGIDDNCDGAIDDLPECFDCDMSVPPYYFCARPASWGMAEELCVAFGGHLVSIGDSVENDEVTTQGEALLGVPFWIGLNDLAVDGTYEWTDGTAFGYTAWATGQPAGAGDDCVAANPAPVAPQQWADFKCGDARAFVCEI